MRISLFVLAALVGGCHWELNDPGTDPKPSQFYFPSGIAMDPAGHYAYIANGNADLKYGGGTVMMVDMLKFDCAIERYRFGGLVSAPCGTDEAYYGQVITDAKCRPDPIDPTIVDCDETPFILPNATVRIGNFAGSIRVHRKDAMGRRLFVAVRGDPSITEIDVDLSRPDLTRPGVLNCFDDVSTLEQRKGYDPVQNITTSPPTCDADKLVQEYVCSGYPTCTSGRDDTGKTQLSPEPFGMEIDEARGVVLVSHLASGQVSAIDIESEASNALRYTSPPFFPPDSIGRHGGFALAKRNPEDVNSLWYLTSSVNPQVATFRVGEPPTYPIFAGFATGVNTSFALGNDVRAIAFDVGGNRAFLTDNNPPSVVVLDTHDVSENGGQPNNVVTDIIDVCQTPSHFGVRRVWVQGATGEPAQLATRVVVVCFLSSQMMIVDPDRPGVLDSVISGLGGPNDLAFNFLSVGDPAPDTMPDMPKRAYVTNFTESTVSIVDLQPGSPTENRVIARLGFPPDGFQP
jgi:hypothetical protein